MTEHTIALDDLKMVLFFRRYAPAGARSAAHSKPILARNGWALLKTTSDS